MRKRVTITIEEKLHEQGKGLARLDRRDLSGELEFLIEKELERRAAQTPKLETPELPKHETAGLPLAHAHAA